MKKGFTMIELIFVIVILGILASVAIPRLASTRTDAEISAAIANLRTLESDIASYYTVKGTIDKETFAEVTNVKIGAGTEELTTGANLKVGNQDCIKVSFVKRVSENDGNVKPAHLKVEKVGTDNVCDQVTKAGPIDAILKAQIKDSKNTVVTTGGIAIGSSTSVYDTLKATESGSGSE